MYQDFHSFCRTRNIVLDIDIKIDQLYKRFKVRYSDKYKHYILPAMKREVERDSDALRKLNELYDMIKSIKNLNETYTSIKTNYQKEINTLDQALVILREEAMDLIVSRDAKNMIIDIESNMRQLNKLLNSSRIYNQQWKSV